MIAAEKLITNIGVLSNEYNSGYIINNNNNIVIGIIIDQFFKDLTFSFNFLLLLNLPIKLGKNNDILDVFTNVLIMLIVDVLSDTTSIIYLLIIIYLTT